jgi:hypothetical protein
MIQHQGIHYAIGIFMNGSFFAAKPTTISISSQSILHHWSAIRSIQCHTLRVQHAVARTAVVFPSSVEFGKR